MSMAVEHDDWDREFASLLDDLSGVQSELLAVLEQKRQRLAKIDPHDMTETLPHEKELVGRLQACQTRRQQLLEQATAAGQPANSLRALARRFPAAQRRAVEPRLQKTQLQARLLQHQALTNWVIAQKTLIHLSQLLEIIATGGRLQPTYEMMGETPRSGGTLLNEIG